MVSWYSPHVSNWLVNPGLALQSLRFATCLPQKILHSDWLIKLTEPTGVFCLLASQHPVKTPSSWCRRRFPVPPRSCTKTGTLLSPVSRWASLLTGGQTSKYLQIYHPPDGGIYAKSTQSGIVRPYPGKVMADTQCLRNPSNIITSYVCMFSEIQHQGPQRDRHSLSAVFYWMPSP